MSVFLISARYANPRFTITDCSVETSGFQGGSKNKVLLYMTITYLMKNINIKFCACFRDRVLPRYMIFLSKSNTLKILI